MPRRWIYIACLASTAVLAAWLDVPKRSQAYTEQRTVLGRLVGRDHEITITTGLAGPRYTIYRAGLPVANELTLEQLRIKDPAAYEQLKETTAATSPAAWAGIDLTE